MPAPLNHIELEKPNRRGVVGVVARDQRLLVIRRSQTVEAPGAFCFPGGAIEGEETESEALRREFLEELGVLARPVRRLWQSQTDWSVDLAWWLAEVETSDRVTPRPAEVASVHWLTIEEIRQLPQLLSSNRQFLDAHQRGEFSLGLSDACE